jgi:hypothetical protein
MNKNQVTIEELRTLIPTIAETLTPVIQSEAGCGKTSLLKMIEQDLGDKYDYIYVDCPVKDMSDIAMTIPNHATKTLESYVGSLFKLKSDKPKIILLDEFMKAPKLLQVIFTRLMLERSVGDTPLPKGSMVFATSNNQSDGLGDGMLAHAGNRVCIMRMKKPDYKSWLQWANNNAVSPLIRAWVHLTPKCLHSYLDTGSDNNPYIFNPKTSGQLSFVSPRSLEKASVIVDNKDTLSENAIRTALSGTIGESACADMFAFLSLEKELPKFEDILANPMETLIPENLTAKLILMFQAVDKLETQDELSSFMQYLSRITNKEMKAVFYTMLMTTDRGIELGKNNKEIRDFGLDNTHLLGDE